MPFRSNLKLDAKIFDKSERKRAFSSLPMRAAREMKNSLRKKMIESKPSGRIEIYEGENSSGRGFQRRFRRSASGQRPAVETTTLSSAFTATRTGDNSAIVDIADKINPRNGESAREYGALLQDDLGRKVMTDKDRDEAQEDYDRRANDTLRDLLT